MRINKLSRVYDWLYDIETMLNRARVIRSVIEELEAGKHLHTGAYDLSVEENPAIINFLKEYEESLRDQIDILEDRVIFSDDLE